MIPDWGSELTRIAAILGVALVLTQVIVFLARRFARRVEGGTGLPGDLQRRATTLASVVRSGALAVLWTVAVISILGQAGIAVGPILAAAGVAGVALGFGAQNLVRDLLGGFFVLLENHYDVGDVVTLMTVTGTVEAVNLRTTVLRGEDGARHIVPNGEVRLSTNLTKAYSRYLFTIPVPHGADLDRVLALAREVARGMGREEPYRDAITHPLTVLGVDGFDSSGTEIKCYVETQPGEQWRVGRELLRRIKRALDEAGIAIGS